MQKKKSVRVSVKRDNKTAKTVADYVAAIPEPARGAFMKLREAIRSSVPAEAVEVISYGMPAFKEKKVLVWFAAFLNHCSLFPTASVIADFEDELKGFSISKGTIQFPIDESLPTALIKKIVKARVAQVGSRDIARGKK